eukprot:Phypoly_transcript_13226.p1 GENE.Phypoly_transcript_13226~~Phypoly_transcript_13226.p1  ORF type:complete len:206 (+),score=63.59 Phypoly_transcript_13226:454-1071(+)
MHRVARRPLGSASSCLSMVTRAGQAWRVSKGVGRSGNEDGPLHDMPDFHFADGRPAPVTKSMEKWMWKRENDKQKLADVRKSALEHNARLGPLRTQHREEQLALWRRKSDVKKLIRAEIEAGRPEREKEEAEERRRKEIHDNDFVGEEIWEGRGRLTRQQAELLASRTAKKEAKADKKGEGDTKEAKKEEDAPAKKKRVKGKRPE